MDAQAKKILATVWCESADSSRADPETYDIDRGEGWTIEYEQNKYPERKVWNQLLREIQGALRDHMREGFLAWQEDLDYPQYAFVKYNGRVYFATSAIAANGDNPAASDNWSQY